jgi:uncharacterized membrane protein YfcA
LEFLVIGITAGFFSGFLGVGGGTILVPILLYMGLSMKVAIGISVTQMLLSSIYGSTLNYLKGSLKINSGIYIGIGGFVGALFSGYIIKISTHEILGGIFLSLVAFSIIKFFISPSETQKEEINSKPLFILIGFFVGAVSISVGVGGALLITPILVGFLHFPLKKAVSLSLFFVVFSSISGFISQSYYGNIDYELGFTVGIASLVGVYFGIKMYHKIDTKIHKKILLFWYILIFILVFEKIFG